VRELDTERVVGVLDKLSEMGASEGVARLEVSADPEHRKAVRGKEGDG